MEAKMYWAMQDEMGESGDSEKDDDDKEEHTNSSQLPFQRKHLHPNEKPQTTFLSNRHPRHRNVHERLTIVGYAFRFIFVLVLPLSTPRHVWPKMSRWGSTI